MKVKPRYLLAAFLILMLMFAVAGCSMEDKNTASGSESKDTSGESAAAGYTMTVDIYDAEEAYFTDDTKTFGTAEITLPFEKAEAEKLGLDILAVRSHDTKPDYTEILNVAVQGYARVYNITKNEKHDTDDWNYPTIEYFEGMSEDEIKIYSKEQDADLRSKLRYKYVMILDKNHCLVVTFKLDGLKKTAETDKQYDEIASKISVVLDVK